LGFLLSAAACQYLLPVRNKSQFPEKYSEIPHSTLVRSSYIRERYNNSAFILPQHSLLLLIRTLKPIKCVGVWPLRFEPMQGRTGFRPLASVSVVMMSWIVASHSHDIIYGKKWLCKGQWWGCELGVECYHKPHL